MNRFVLLFLLLQVMPVLADTSVAPNAIEKANPSDAPVTRDQFGRPQICDGYLPPGTPRAPTVIATLLAVHVMPTGEVRGVSLFKSSGNTVFDQAALSCAAQRRPGAIVQGGNKIEADEVMGVYWYPTWSTYTHASALQVPNICNVTELYPHYAIRNHEQGDTTMLLRIADDGTVKKVSIITSSGFPVLDQASVDCASAWRFYPVGQNGKSIEVDREYRINWQLRP